MGYLVLTAYLSTGAGKSSIMTALYRLVELTSGLITIDGVDISKLGLTDLRRALAIIPQDPVCFFRLFSSHYISDIIFLPSCFVRHFVSIILLVYELTFLQSQELFEATSIHLVNTMMLLCGMPLSEHT